ncbi:S8 family peptidase [Streptomyces indicus]|uniref:Serine protease, subtilisin family n=1 Tax=Streptomyces indicus TaxID=417292 RepID=A0A1G8V726_9ACTN|nr:S8 family serine peptidase [Streptomyces indicus]SDJ61135.1 Serine protease, subtilisin family [Streptomyces indicus]
MRPISRKALVAATAAALAATLAAPSQAAQGGSEPDRRPLVGSQAAQAAGKGAQESTVTLVNGDKVLVTTDDSGRSTAVALPREDGTVPFFQTRTAGKDLYVYPEGVTEALAAGTVDEELFNVSGLIRQGYDDRHAASLPLIAVYDKTVDVGRSAPAAPRGAERALVLDAIDGVALKADKKKAADFWQDVTTAKSRATGGLKKLWLDKKVESTLDRSTAQVHAPEAWAAGYDGKGTKVAVLDTGTDTAHPDLEGRVTKAENFTDSDTAQDRDGHGTHTISTVGGSGAASGGKNKGVAPGTELLSGKVLNDYGQGMESWIIAGMQWAVDSKADVVSMSLGSGAPSDCSDPMAMATEELAAKSGTLFVVAAGNLGPQANTVSSPGCAPSVLTVGAVDREDRTAQFSSRGPVTGSHTLKPEIAAPGVGISAAQAGGRGVYAYQSMSGTSMATPHVAGAAAILKQRHPDWTPAQLKAALVASADQDIPGDVREVGGGVLDVKGAIDQKVLSAPAVQGGAFNWPQDSSDRTTVEVPYTNTGDEPVRLNLSVEDVTGNDGSRIRSAVARVEQRSVTVPAGATVKVPLRIDPTAYLTRGQYGDVAGRLVAETRGTTVSTPFSLYVQPETVTLRVKLVDRQGKPASAGSSVDVINMDANTGERRFNEGAADQTYELRPGSYFLSGYVATPDAGENATLVDSLTYLGHPQVELKKDTTIVLDARAAHRLDVDTDKPAELRGTTLSFLRSWDDIWGHGGTASGGRSIRGYYASVEGRATEGEFSLGSHWRGGAPQISELKVVGGQALHPVTSSTNSANLDGTGTAQLVDAGAGTPAELTAAGVKGKIALVKLPEGSTSVARVSRDAKTAGALAVIAHRDAPGRWYPAAGFVGGELPALGLPSDEAKALLDQLAKGTVELSWKATAKTPYMYNLSFSEDGPLYRNRTYKVRDSRLAKVDSTVHAMGVAADYLDFVKSVRPDGTEVMLGDIETVPAPGERTDYYTAGDGARWQRMLSSSFPWGEFMVGTERELVAGRTVTERWYDGAVAPAAPRDQATGKEVLTAERQGELMGFAPGFWGDGSHHGEAGGFGDIGNLSLSKDGEEIGTRPVPYGVFEVPAEEAAYELTMRTEKFGAPARVWERSQGVQTTWKFRSKLDSAQYSVGLPLLYPRLALPEDGMKTLAAADGQKIELKVTGHAGYTPGAIKSAALSYSYDGGETWTEAEISGSGATRTATVDHAGASGKPVTLKTTVTDVNGNTVEQLVVRAYDVR